MTHCMHARSLPHEVSNIQLQVGHVTDNQIISHLQKLPVQKLHTIPASTLFGFPVFAPKPLMGSLHLVMRQLYELPGSRGGGWKGLGGV